MADCLYHGYSGAPGGCPDCDLEARYGLEPGDANCSDERLRELIEQARNRKAKKK